MLSNNHYLLLTGRCSGVLDVKWMGGNRPLESRVYWYQDFLYQLTLFDGNQRVRHNNTLLKWMFQEVLSDYLDRFAGLFTESLYNAKGYEDYNYMRKCCDYLDCDRVALTTPRNAPAGLRNIGNTCYLNTILQLLFHINYLREKISSSENLPSKLLKKLQSLFGIMSVGKLPFADPSEVFEELRVGNPEVFAPGVQNDFHEVFTLLLEAVGEGYKNTSPEDARYIRKLLLGKMTTRIDYGEGKINKNSEFNIINLDSQLGCFQKAFEKWKKYQIPDFTTPSSQVVTAQAENIFLQTPALMVFFINRVAYREGHLHKDCQSFLFQDSILVGKAFQSQKTMSFKTVAFQQQREIHQEKQELRNWLAKAEVSIENIRNTIKYIKTRDAPLLSEPMVENPMGEEARLSTLQYLREQEQALQRRSELVKAEIKQLEDRLNRVLEEQNCQRYVLWGVMIHEGTSPVFGHYKLCLLLGDTWYEFNDKKVTVIGRQEVDGYRDRGEICCLFYRRPLLICNSDKMPVPFPLKNAVSQYERQLRRDIDKARILQALYQETESISLLLEYEMRVSSQEKFQFFFKSMHYALAEKESYQVCKGILLQEQVRTQLFRDTLSRKLIQPIQQTPIPLKTFGIPQDYFDVREALTSFLDKQILLVSVGEAYEQLSRKKLKIGCEKGKEVLKQTLQVIILKGLYYMRALSDYDCLPHQDIVFKLNNALDKMLSVHEECEFTFVCISIKASIKLLKGSKQLTMAAQAHQIQDYGQYFKENFKFWMNQVEKIGSVDEANFMAGAPPLTKTLRLNS